MQTSCAATSHGAAALGKEGEVREPVWNTHVCGVGEPEREGAGPLEAVDLCKGPSRVVALFRKLGRHIKGPRRIDNLVEGGLGVGEEVREEGEEVPAHHLPHPHNLQTPTRTHAQQQPQGLKGRGSVTAGSATSGQRWVKEAAPSRLLLWNASRDIFQAIPQSPPPPLGPPVKLSCKPFLRRPGA